MAGPVKAGRGANLGDEERGRGRMRGLKDPAGTTGGVTWHRVTK